MKFSKKFLILLTVLISTISLVACSGGEKDDASSDKTIEVVYKSPDDSFKAWMEEAKKDFEESNEGINVKITPIDSNEGNYPNKTILMMKSDDTAPDIVMEDSEGLKADAAAGYLEPITSKVENWEDWKHFYDPVKNGVKGEDGKTYGVPISTDVRGLWYNKTVFKEAGLDVPWNPKTWDDVLEAAKTIKDDVKVPIWMNSGKAMGEGTTMQTFLMLLYGTDSKLYNDETGKWVLGSEGFLDSLEFIDEVHSNDLGPSLSWGITGQAGAKISTELMPKGEVGIALDGNWMSGNWLESGNSPWPEWKENIDITAMPTQNGQANGKVTVSGGWTLAIPSKADNKDLAWEFIKTATSKENLRYGTALTPRKDIAELEDYQQLTYQQKITDFLDFTHYRPTYDSYPLVSSNIQKAVEAVTTDTLSPKEAMEQFKEDVKRDVGEEKVEE
ncbi:Multiple sugar-binding protein precursor [Paraliobacillus sp. PM-2]|uniref:extracellular solute-binding protein n=1 Tax=Paraliobacillus sp. PM-2 TaxID=1462524 RepID=UPI00061BF459|nr:extracellular solute-binding protein [Paraliobacillus sp. PM-2]CQR48486.1 Multiple sugar-binding protein precursor [Paraliobacillus sp. PM-2]